MLSPMCTGMMSILCLLGCGGPSHLHQEQVPPLVTLTQEVRSICGAWESQIYSQCSSCKTTLETRGGREAGKMHSDRRADPLVLGQARHHPAPQVQACCSAGKLYGRSSQKWPQCYCPLSPFFYQVQSAVRKECGLQSA